MALAKKTIRPGALRPYELIPSVYALDVALCAVTALAYAVALPIGLIAGVPQRCFSRIRKAPRDEEEWLVVMGCGYAYPTMIDARLNAALGRGVRGAPADGTEACEVLDRASFRGTKTVRDRV